MRNKKWIRSLANVTGSVNQELLQENDHTFFRMTVLSAP